MRRVKINDKPINVVDRWDDMKLKHLIGLEKIDGTDEVQVFSVLSGINIEVLDNSKAIVDDIYGVVSFIYESTPDWKKLKPPTHLVLDGKPHKLPSPDKCALGQNIMLDNLMSKSLLEVVPTALAIYFQPLVDGGQFDRKRLPAIEAMIMEANAIDAYATASFFLKSGKNLLRISRVGYLLPKPIQ